MSKPVSRSSPVPFSDEGERGLLSVVLQDPRYLDQLDRCPDVGELFWKWAVAAQTMLGWVRSGVSTDPKDICARVGEQWQEMLGMATAADLVDLVYFCSYPRQRVFEGYLRLARNAATLRRVVCRAQEVTAEAREVSLTDDVPAFAGRCEALFTGLATRAAEDTSMRAACLEAVMEMEAVAAGGSVAIPTGLFRLDTMLGGGVRAGEMMILAARPSMGKTSLAWCMLAHAACAGVSVGMFSLEMTRVDLVNREVARQMGAGVAEVRSAFTGLQNKILREKMQRRLQGVISQVSQWPVQISDDADVTPTGMRAQARLWVRQFGVRMIFVDYLQLMNSEGAVKGENREGEVRRLSKAMKAMAKELRIPVVVLAQLNRESERRGDGKLRMSDLRESGALEQDADVVLMIGGDAGAEERQLEEMGSEEAVARVPRRLVLAKQRNGAVSMEGLPVWFHSKSMMFTDRTE